MGLEYKLTALNKLNLKLFLDYTFLRESGFTNVASGTLFVDNSKMSLLLPDPKADAYFGLPVGSVWQSPFRQWVYETGVALDGPIKHQNGPRIASGVYLYGAFRPSSGTLFPHTIDYINGRVIFDDPLPLNTDVHSDFAYRSVRIGFEDQFNNQFNDGFLESKYTTNPLTSNHIVYPSGSAQPFPAIFIEHANRMQKPYEIGNRSLEIHDTFKLYIWALSSLQKDDIVDILTSQDRKNIPIIDFNYVPLPLSGIFGTISNEYIPYQNLIANNSIVTSIGSGLPVKYQMFIDSVKFERRASQKEFELGVIVFNTTTYLNAPTSSIGHQFTPF